MTYLQFNFDVSNIITLLAFFRLYDYETFHLLLSLRQIVSLIITRSLQYCTETTSYKEGNSQSTSLSAAFLPSVLQSLSI